jgi:hypothetical protein
MSWHNLWAGSTFGRFMAFAVGPLLAALPVSLGLYGIVRAIGWVIGGFAAS